MNKRWLKKLGVSMLSFTLIVSLISTALPIHSSAAEAVQIGIDVQKAYDVDVVLAVDNSTQNIDTYKEDLQSALELRGVNASNLNIQSVQVNETNILEGKFELKLYWPGPDIDMDAHVEFWSSESAVDELSYRKLAVYGSTLNNDDRVGGTGEIITLSLDTIPANIVELKVYINPYEGSDTSTMYLNKTVNNVKQEIIQYSGFVTTKFYFGSFKRNQDSWDFHFNNGSIFPGKEVEVISKDFMEVLREPDWRPSARKYIVNLNDQTVPDFDDSIALGEIMTRMDNDQIHYIGWGEDSDGAGAGDLTQNQAESFIRKNNDKGTFVNRTGSTYQQQVDAMADYIADNSRSEANNEYLELGQNYDLIVSPASELTNTKDENWPQGKWRIQHDPSVYANNTGVVPYSGEYLDDFLPTFNKVGRYDIYYSDVLVKTLYVHRKPVSRFDVEVNGNNEVTLTNLSYDHDTPAQNNGIQEAIWKWKLTTDEEWTSGQPASFVPNQDYIIQLMVKDYQGTWSTARSRYQSTQSGAGKPIADFELSANRLIWPESTIQIENTSYDPRSADLTEQEWTVTKNNDVVYTGSSPKLDFTSDGVGTYKISLRTKNQSGTWSETFSRFLNILPNSQPEISSIGSQTVIEGVTKEIPFQVKDEETGPYSVTVTGTSSNPAVIPNEHIIVTGNGKDRVVSITPIFGQSGNVTITLTASDGDMTVQQTFTVTVVERPAPDRPSIESQTVKPGSSIKITSDAPAVGLTAWLAPSGTTSFQEGTTMTKLAGDGSGDTIVTPLAEGTYYLYVMDAYGKVSAASENAVIVDNTPPNMADIQLPIAGDNVINAYEVKQLVVSGTAEKDAKVEVTFKDEQSQTIVITTYANENGEWSIDPSDISAVADGEITVIVKVIDEAGNESVEREQNVQKATVKPNNQDDVLSSNQAVKGNTVITLDAAAGEGLTIFIAPHGTAWEDLIANGTTITSVSGTYESIHAPTTDGTYRVYIRDAAGNVSEPSNATIVVDNIEPTINSLIPDTTDWVNDSVVITVDATDSDGSGIAEVKYASGHQTANYFIANGISVNDDSFEVDTNGEYTVYVRDHAGNVTIQLIQISNIDKEKPTPPVIQLQPDRDFFNGDYTISITPGQDTVTEATYTEYRITGAIEVNWTPYNEAEALVLTEDGTYTIETRSYDDVGNVSDIAVRTIVINRELTVFPTVSISPDKAFSNENVTVSITKTFDEQHQDEGENSVVYYKIPSLGLNEYVEYTGAFDITQEGTTIIQIMVRDRAGNEVTATKVINIDKTAPTNQNQVLADDVVAQGNTLITIQPSNDGEDTIWLAPAGTTWFTESESMTKASGGSTGIVTPALDGEYKIYVIDKSGNVSEPSEATVTVDNIPPAVNGIENNETYKEYPTVSFEDGTATSATLNGVPFQSGARIEANGEYTIVVTDAAGNSTVITFVVDYDKESVDKDTAALELDFAPGDHPEWVSTDISLRDKGFFDSEIEWTSSHEDILSHDGKVTAPSADTEVTLTAKITKGDFTLEKTFTVLVKADPVKPVIALNGGSNVIVEQGQIYVEQGVQAVDNIDGNITDKVVMSGFIDTKTIGVYTLIYTVSDKAGNQTQVERTVTVVKPSVPASTIIQVDGDQTSTDNKVRNALEEAKKQKAGKIVLVVDEPVETGAPVQVSISKDQLKTAYDQHTKMELRTDNASIIVPIRDLDLTQFTGNSRLELVIEQVDVAQAENQVLVTAIQSMNDNFAIYDNKVFDFKMRVIEEDSQGNVTRTEDIKNFKTTEDIVLTISVGTNINEQLKFMTFYFNEASEEWEYIRSSYDGASGNMTLLTNHLSIYSVMSATKAQKQAELAHILNKTPITIQEVRSIIEDPDMDFDQEAMNKYDAFTDVHKDAVAQDIINKKPNGGYTYPSLSAQVISSVNDKHNAIVTDTVKPVITLSGPSTIYVTKGSAYIEQGVTATDDQDGNITGRVILIGSVDTSQNGTYILRYLITDVNGNQSEVTRTVIVHNPYSSPIFSSPVKEAAGETALPVVILDSQKDRYLIKENKDQAMVSKKEPQMNIVGKVYTIEAASNAPIGQIVVQMKYVPSEITNLNQLAVYMYDEAKQRWVSVGGIIDAQNHTVTIKLDSPASIALMENKKAFKDLDGHWAKDIVEFLAARQIIAGDSEGNFNPNMGITRAEFSTLIVRMLNLPINESASQFADVTDEWYEAYITTAQQYGIVKGVSDSSFEPERVVSRQEMAAIIIRTLRKYKDVSFTDEDLKSIAEFADTDSISAWAYEDVYAARKLELMIGRDGNKFAPRKPTLRGEAASVIYNLLKKLELI